MDPLASQLEALLDLDARHDDLLERLDDLGKRVERVLAELAGSHGQPEAMHGGQSSPPVEMPRLVDRPPQPQSQRDAEADSYDAGDGDPLN
jgi:hypothetical protein